MGYPGVRVVDDADNQQWPTPVNRRDVWPVAIAVAIGIAIGVAAVVIIA